MLQEACTTDLELKDWLDSCERLFVRPTLDDYERYFDNDNEDEE